jgi:hypothetical protein
VFLSAVAGVLFEKRSTRQAAMPADAGNTRHAPPGVFGDVRVVTPAEFLAAYVRMEHGQGSPGPA